jgi:Fe-S cluster assembly scaffold protein SufB
MASILISTPPAGPVALAGDELQVEIAAGITAELHETGVRKLQLTLKDGASAVLHAVPSSAVEREVRLEGADARFELVERFVAAGRGELRTGTAVRHLAPGTVSRLDTRGIVTEAAHAEVRGLAHIGKDAQGSDSFLAEHALILDPDARAATFPYLEIEQNDVKAGHAASTSRPDPEQVFYLRSRGLGEAEARSLLAHGFLRLDALAPALREALRARLVQKVGMEVLHA